MSISVLAAFLGVLVAAVSTGLLGGQCIRSPRISYIAWTVGVFALTVALLGQSIGFATGFAAWTFRLVQLTAQLVAPLMLAWGLVELVARNTAVRFAARLVTAALVVVAGVVLATDPLASAPFTKSWPQASAHYQVIPHYTLILAHLTVAASALAVLAICVSRERDGHVVTGPWPPAVAAVAAAALLLVVMRAPLPGPAYPGLSLVAAGLVWFGMSRIAEPGSEAISVARPASGTRASRPAGPPPGDKLVASSRRRPEAGFNGPDFPPPGRGAGRGGEGDRDRGGDPDLRPGERDRPGPGRDRAGLDRSGLDRRGQDGWDRDGRDRPRYEPGAPGAEPATGMFDASLPGLADLPGLPDLPLPAPAAGPGTDLALPVTPPHGLIAIYTLLEDKVADFDRAADEVAEQVRANEPDTLVYVIHTVPKAPMQRIFYEVYRDRAAYERHEKQDYVQRFVTARRPYVLATNVIELRIKYAKVAPLPQAEAQAAQARAQAPAGNSRALGGSGSNLPAVRNGTGGHPSPDRQPTYTPRDPLNAPRDPARAPRDPGYAPGDPGYAPRDPGQAPRDPGYAPRNPGYPPRAPDRAPRDPLDVPGDPGYAPRNPGYPPRDPGYRSRNRGPSRNRDPHRSQAPDEPPAAPRFGRI
jgi:quinol monooxygenase YgiN